MKAILRTNNRQTADPISIAIQSFNGDYENPELVLNVDGDAVIAQNDTDKTKIVVMAKKGRGERLFNKREVIYKYIYNFLHYTMFEAFSDGELNLYGIVFHSEASPIQVEVMECGENCGTFEAELLVNGAHVYARETPELRAKRHTHFEVAGGFKDFVIEHSEEIASLLHRIWGYR